MHTFLKKILFAMPAVLATEVANSAVTLTGVRMVYHHSASITIGPDIADFPDFSSTLDDPIISRHNYAEFPFVTNSFARSQVDVIADPGSAWVFFKQDAEVFRLITVQYVLHIDFVTDALGGTFYMNDGWPQAFTDPDGRLAEEGMPMELTLQLVKHTSGGSLNQSIYSSNLDPSSSYSIIYSAVSALPPNPRFSGGITGGAFVTFTGPATQDDYSRFQSFYSVPEPNVAVLSMFTVTFAIVTRRRVRRCS